VAWLENLCGESKLKKNKKEIKDLKIGCLKPGDKIDVSAHFHDKEIKDDEIDFANYLDTLARINPDLPTLEPLLSRLSALEEKMNHLLNSLRVSLPPGMRNNKYEWEIK